MAPPIEARRRLCAAGEGDHPGVMRRRHAETRPYPAERHAVVAAMRAGRHHFPVHGLTAVDVTDVVQVLHAHDPPLSLTAHVVAAVGRAVARHPDVAA